MNLTVWEKNSAIIHEQYPGLLDGDTDITDLKIEYTASGLPTVLIKGMYVHSPRFPEREGQRLAQSCIGASPPSQPLIVLGFGLGYAANAAAFADTDTSPYRPVIIVEKNIGLLRTAFELRDLSRLLTRPGVVFVTGGSGEGIITALALFEKSMGKRLDPLVMRNRTLTGLDEQWYAAVENRIRVWAARDDVNTATLKKFGRRWVRNLSRNMNSIRDMPGISRLAGIAAAAPPHPVFLAAAGPSLNDIAPLLPDIHRRCIVVAVDTSLRFLLRNGIEPDFAMVVDPQFWNSRHLDRCVSPHTRLIAESAVYPPLMRLPFKEVFLCGSQYPLGIFIEQRTDPKGHLGAGGSVAAGAWDFCRLLGTRQIWIAGLDLAFPGLKTHFRGAQFEEKTLAESGRLNPAETWQFHALRDGGPFLAPALCGGQVLTDRRLSLYAAWFENRFSRFPAVCNYSLCSNGNSGIAIEGLEPVTIETILSLPERRAETDQRLEAAFTRIETDFFDPEETRRRAARYENAISALRSGLEKIQKACEEGEKIIKQAMGKNLNTAEREKTLAALDEINRIIEGSEVKEIAGFLFPPDALEELKIPSRDENGSVPFYSYMESSARLYRSLTRACAEHKIVQ